jgi:hypothetical protein
MLDAYRALTTLSCIEALNISTTESVPLVHGRVIHMETSYKDQRLGPSGTTAPTVRISLLFCCLNLQELAAFQREVGGSSDMLNTKDRCSSQTSSPPEIF